ncbi:16S rRNA (uracil(1498)-N(3))-methyltransferase [Porticoccaceae bacterium LTM1]|nr:16S rRNA (uracil(1498)-N(3))-methyltransferase [Porticoccaceae bacterium LTM1]
MNLLLLEQDDFTSANRVQITGRRLQHMREVHQVVEGQTLKAGLINGDMGAGTITSVSPSAVEMELELTTPPPAPLPLTLVLALPRPKMMRRVLQTIATMGVKQVYLINSYRVEKSYWQSPFLSPDAIREQLILGLEQGCDTALPEVHLHKRFKPFVEDDLPAIVGDSTALVAHPKGNNPCPINIQQPTTLAIGPEGGFIPYEVEKLEEAGFQAVTLGARILRVETAIPTLLSRLYPL